MKTIISFLRSLSGTVHEEQCDGRQQDGAHRQEDEDLMVKGSSSDELVKSLTVWRKSLLVSCNGFTVIDSSGNLAYRVDNYRGNRSREVILMDAVGKSVVTVRRHKKLGILDNWQIYEGDVGDDTVKSRKKPFCCARRKQQINAVHTKSKIQAYISGAAHPNSTRSSWRRDLVIEGSYASRSCKVLEEETGKVVAEVRRKEETVEGATFGLEVFVLVVQPGFDAGFAMALVMLLDQMFS